MTREIACIKSSKKRCALDSRISIGTVLIPLQNSRHPWQSWKDRYLKYVKPNPPAEALDTNWVLPDQSKPPHSQQIGRDNSSEPPNRIRIGKQRSASRDVNNASPNTSDNEQPQDVHESSSRKNLSPQVADSHAINGETRIKTEDQSVEKGFESSPHFTEEDKYILLYEAKRLLRVHESRRAEAWRHWARHNPKASGREWAKFFNDIVLPVATRAHRISEARDLVPTSQTSDDESSSSDHSTRKESPVQSQRRFREHSTPIKSESGSHSPNRTPTQSSPARRHRSASVRISPILTNDRKRNQNSITNGESPSNKKVRFSQNRDVRETPRRSRRLAGSAATQDDVEVINLVNERESETSDQEEHREVSHLEVNGAVNGDNEGPFMIWQGTDQPPEDEKENSPRRTPPSRARERPQDALDLTESGTEFRLEPATDFPSIDDISLSESEGNNMSNATSRGRYRPLRHQRRGLAKERNPKTAMRGTMLDNDDERALRTAEHDINQQAQGSRELDASGENAHGRVQARKQRDLNSDDGFEDAMEIQNQPAEDQSSHEQGSQDSKTEQLYGRQPAPNIYGSNVIPPSSPPAAWGTSMRNVDSHRSHSSSASSGFEVDHRTMQDKRIYLDTQKLLDLESQDLELMRMPLPEESDGHSQVSQGSENSQRDTQSLFDRATLSPEMIIPMPEPSPRDAKNSQSTRSPSPAKQGYATSSQIDKFFEYQARRGFDEDTVIWALERTSFNSALAQEVLTSQKTDGSLPRKPGIFSEEEDIIMRKGDAREMRRTQLFHGTDLFWARVEVLNGWDRDVD